MNVTLLLFIDYHKCMANVLTSLHLKRSLANAHCNVTDRQDYKTMLLFPRIGLHLLLMQNFGLLNGLLKMCTS